MSTSSVGGPPSFGPEVVCYSGGVSVVTNGHVAVPVPVSLPSQVQVVVPVSDVNKPGTPGSSSFRSPATTPVPSVSAAATESPVGLVLRMRHVAVVYISD